MKKLLVILLGVACINMIGCGETESRNEDDGFIKEIQFNEIEINEIQIKGIME